MKNLTTFRDTGSLIAGLLIGVAIVVPIFAMTIADLGNTETVWVIVAPIIVLAVGVMLQAAVTRPSQPRTSDPRLLAVSRLASIALRDRQASTLATYHAHDPRTLSVRPTLGETRERVLAA